MKPAEIRGLDEDQLAQQLNELHHEWRTLRFDEAVGKLTATARIRQIRKDIARIHTERRWREIEQTLRATGTTGN